MPAAERPAVPNQVDYSKLRYRDRQTLDFKQEDREHPEFYSIAFNQIDPRYSHVFAAVGSSRVRFFEAVEVSDEDDEESVSGSGSGSADRRTEFRLVQEYREEGSCRKKVVHDERGGERKEVTREQFYSCCWSVGMSGDPLLCYGGISGVIKVINFRKKTLDSLIVGHGEAINDLKPHPFMAGVILSAAKDDSVRIWNVQTRTQVMVFAGLEGHRSEVFTADFHPLNGFFVASGGIDYTVKIWDLTQHQSLLDKSFSWDGPPSAFPTAFVQKPTYSCIIHNGYVDCVSWYGDLLLTKSLHNSLILWEAVYGENGVCDGARPLMRYHVENCEVFFMKFAVSADHRLVALGNTTGKVFLWDVEGEGKKDGNPKGKKARQVMSVGKGKQFQNSVVRMTAFSCDNRYLACCCEDGTIACWTLGR
mmetsp:Transcript_34907/g.75556  ORF Transcript_34907/g.75556 Transcript_34907/m.75556 type:complete len:420 (+) Transcript_34907:273-1532(+)